MRTALTVGTPLTDCDKNHKKSQVALKKDVSLENRSAGGAGDKIREKEDPLVRNLSNVIMRGGNEAKGFAEKML